MDNTMETLRSEWGHYIQIPYSLFQYPNLTEHEFAVYVALCSWVRPDKDTIWPSYNKIAERARVSNKTARRAVEGLIEKKLLLKGDRITNTGQKSNEYIIQIPRIPQK